jgi:thymidylate synthase (FAD)
MSDRINVLDKGYVRMVDQLGDDLSVVNAARVSYAKESSELSDRDKGLLAFLAREGHDSPFRHAALTFEIYAPLMVARQWFKYAVGSTHVEDQFGWNESSRRYITELEEFYIPGGADWRSKPENSKQGSGPNLPAQTKETMELWESGQYDFDTDKAGPGAELTGNYWTRELFNFTVWADELYRKALAAGIAPEQARLFLPANGLYVRWRWTVSLAGVINFLQQRLEHDAQFEIQEYARAVEKGLSEAFPESYKLYFGDNE